MLGLDDTLQVYD